MMTAQHPRFNRKVWAFKSDFVASLAKWLVRQSPYTVPNDLETCLEKFNEKIGELANFDTAGLAEIDLSTLTKKLNPILESIPEIMMLNVPQSGHNGHVFVTPASPNINPDDDFIDILAVAQNITCDFAEHADAECYLDSCSEMKA